LLWGFQRVSADGNHYALARRKPRKLKRLFDRHDELLAMVLREYRKHNPEATPIS